MPTPDAAPSLAGPASSLDAEHSPRPASTGPPRLEPISCDGCGRAFMAADGAELIPMLQGSCSDCGGRFQLSAPTGP